MKVCVVGGPGNISASIVRLLLQLGHEVACFNRGRSGLPPTEARVIRGDRKDRRQFEKAMQREKFDAAIDMLCFTREEAESTLRAFRGAGHVVHCSTVCTYGIRYDWLPATEDHPLRPISDYGRNKVAADNAFLEAWHRDGFPVTIIKPSTTYGPRMGLLRQIAWEFAWIDRVRRGKSIAICGDGQALHQFLHVDDAALGFAYILGRRQCFGQTYNLVREGYTTWADYHRTAMNAIGREVELVGLPLASLLAAKVPHVDICRDIFAHNVYYCGRRIARDVPEFRPVVSLEEGMRRVLETMDRESRVPDSRRFAWEDKLIAAQKKVGALKLS
jgi:nucleoside-diphosphate-sugar epimerase